MVAHPDRVDQLIAQWRAELPDVLGPRTEFTKRILLLAVDLDEATRRELPELGLTVAEFDVLVALRRSGKPYRMKPNELSRGLMLSSGGMSNVTNRLVTRGLVEREADPEDGRSTLVRLTGEGVALAEKAVRANVAAHNAVFADVPPDVLGTATDALRAVFAAIDKPPQRRPAAADRRPRSVS